MELVVADNRILMVGEKCSHKALLQYRTPLWIPAVMISSHSGRFFLGKNGIWVFRVFGIFSCGQSFWSFYPPLKFDRKRFFGAIDWLSRDWNESKSNPHQLFVDIESMIRCLQHRRYIPPNYYTIRHFPTSIQGLREHRQQLPAPWPLKLQDGYLTYYYHWSFKIDLHY